MFGADRPKPGVRNQALSLKAPPPLGRALDMRDGHPAAISATGREPWGYEAPPLGLTSDAPTVAEARIARKGILKEPKLF